MLTTASSTRRLWPFMVAIWVGVGLSLALAWMLVEDSEADAGQETRSSWSRPERATSAGRPDPATDPLSMPATPIVTSDRAPGAADDGSLPTAVPAGPAADGHPPATEWAATGPWSDYAGPVQGWGEHRATCADETFLVYGAQTDPRRYEYVVCSTSSGQLRYHGIDVDSGADIRLEACVDPEGRYVARASRNHRYEVVDARGRPLSASGITLFQSATAVTWNYGVTAEWGMQNLPHDFVKC